MRKNYTSTLHTGQQRHKTLLVCAALLLYPSWQSLGTALEAQERATTGTQQGEISGRVQSTSGEALIGATIRVVGKTIGTTTDAKGNFRLRGVATGDTLEISYVGMKKQTIKLGGRTKLEVKLEEDGLLEQVVVTGYQQVKRERMTGSVATLRSSDFKNLDVKSVDQVLKGTVAGVQTIASGRPGEDAKIRIRGTNTLGGNAAPIWIVDGMPLQGEAPAVNASSNLTAMLSQTGLGNISPDDIESINVLKDAAASAIYGARAANGVIVVTTKRGKEGPTKFNVTTHFGLTDRPTSNVRMMNTAEKIRFERELYSDFGPNAASLGRVTQLLHRADQGIITAQESEAEIASLQGTNTNWLREVYRPAWSTQVNLSLSGGSKRTQHYTALNLTNEQGTEYNNVYRRLSLSTKLNHALSSKLDLQTDLSVSYRTNQNTAMAIRPLEYAIYANPYERPDSPDLSWTIRPSRVHNGLTWTNLKIREEMERNTNYSKYLEATVSPKIEWQTPLEGLELSVQATLSASTTNTRSEVAENSYTSYENNWLRNNWQSVDLAPKQVRGSLEEGSFNRTSYALRSLAEYSKDFGEHHHLNLLAGAEASHSVSYSSGVYFPIFDMEHRVISYPELVEGTELKRVPFSRLGSTGRYENKLASLFFNATYSYRDRYALSSSLRYDGSDVIGNQNQFTPLWNVSGRWNLHNESWFNIKAINALSLRVGYGLTGSIDRTALPYVLMTFGDADLYDGVTTPTNFSYANPNIKWQTKRDFNIGLDASFLDDRFRFGVNYYHNEVIDLLDRSALPYSSGVGTITRNISSLVNKGVELELGAEIIRGSKFTWSVRGNVAINTNEVTKTFYRSIEEAPRGQTNQSARLIVQGYPQSAIFAYRFTGIDPTTGHTMAIGDDGQPFDMDLLINRTLNLQAPLVSYIGSSEPPVTGGFSTSLKYDRWVLDASFEFMAGHYIPTFNRFSSLSSSNRHISDQNRWRTPGDVAQRPALNYNSSAYDRYRYDANYERGDYLRASYITLGYNLPPTILNKLGIASARLSLTGSNLFTFTRYRGIDPSLMGQFGYPNSRKYSLSINLSF